MSKYVKQAKDFLTACNAKMQINFIGADINHNWKENTARNKYNVTITTPKGSMAFDFWDSIINTEIKNMTFEKFCITKYGCYPQDLSTYLHPSRSKATDEWKHVKDSKPSEYSILACLTKYDPGTMHDFFDEMGYDIDSVDDMFSFMNTYNAVVKEYRDLCRIFTKEQMEMLREIY